MKKVKQQVQLQAMNILSKADNPHRVQLMIEQEQVEKQQQKLL